MSWLEYEQTFLPAAEACGWEHPAFDKIRRIIREEALFLENSVNVDEGIIQCKKCGSFKTYSYQKQVRAADEGFTLFVACFHCDSQWTL